MDEGRAVKFNYFIIMVINRKKILIVAFFSLFASVSFAPGDGFITLVKNPPIEPFLKLINAVGMAETGLDTLAYNPLEEAAGFLQIRPIRVLDYNLRTGKNLTLRDMFSYKVSEEIFMYYALKIGPYDFERIARNWNGSGRDTFFYWEMVKAYL